MSDFTERAGAAVVVGGSGGIGRAVVAMLAERGATVVATYRTRPDPLHELAARLPGVSSLPLREREADAVMARVVADHGGIHTLVYAAGPPVPMTHLSEVEPQVMEEQLVSDAAAFFAVVRAALPHLRVSRGSVVAVTTAATSRFPKRDGLSSAPKAAVEAMVRALAAEEGRYGVRLNAVGPGMLTDGMAAGLIASGELSPTALETTRGNIPLGRFGRAVDVAEAVCFLASDRAGFVSGQKLDVDGGYGV